MYECLVFPNHGPDSPWEREEVQLTESLIPSLEYLQNFEFSNKGIQRTYQLPDRTFWRTCSMWKFPKATTNRGDETKKVLRIHEACLLNARDGQKNSDYRSCVERCLCTNVRKEQAENAQARSQTTSRRADDATSLVHEAQTRNSIRIRSIRFCFPGLHRCLLPVNDDRRMVAEVLCFF